MAAAVGGERPLKRLTILILAVGLLLVQVTP